MVYRYNISSVTFRSATALGTRFLMTTYSVTTWKEKSVLKMIGNKWQMKCTKLWWIKRLVDRHILQKRFTNLEHNNYLKRKGAELTFSFLLASSSYLISVTILRLPIFTTLGASSLYAPTKTLTLLDWLQQHIFQYKCLGVQSLPPNWSYKKDMKM